jgi:hypothetical protein
MLKKLTIFLILFFFLLNINQVLADVGACIEYRTCSSPLSTANIINNITTNTTFNTELAKGIGQFSNCSTTGTNTLNINSGIITSGNAKSGIASGYYYHPNECSYIQSGDINKLSNNTLNIKGGSTTGNPFSFYATYRAIWENINTENTYFSDYDQDIIATDTKNNIINVSGTGFTFGTNTSLHSLYVKAGKYTAEKTISGNQVNISGEANITNLIDASAVYLKYIRIVGSGKKINVTDNKIDIKNATLGKSGATLNLFTVSSLTDSSANNYANITANTLSIEKSTINSTTANIYTVYDTSAVGTANASAVASGNTIEIKDGNTINSAVVISPVVSSNTNVNSNTVEITGTTFTNNTEIYGSGNSSIKPVNATGNTVNILTGVSFAPAKTNKIYGATATSDAFTGNTLNLSSKISITEIGNFEFINLILPDGFAVDTTGDTGDTMINLTSSLDLANVKINANVSSVSLSSSEATVIKLICSSGGITTLPTLVGGGSLLDLKIENNCLILKKETPPPAEDPPAGGGGTGGTGGSATPYTGDGMLGLQSSYNGNDRNTVYSLDYDTSTNKQILFPTSNGLTNGFVDTLPNIESDVAESLDLRMDDGIPTKGRFQTTTPECVDTDGKYAKNKKCVVKIDLDLGGI